MPDFYQMYECDGFRAKVTVEWTYPDGHVVPPDRQARAEEIADDTMSKLAWAPLEIVQAMRGRIVDMP